LLCVKGGGADEPDPLTIFHPKDTWKRTTFTNYTVRRLSRKVIEGGKPVAPSPSLAEVCAYAEREKQSFWDEYKRLDNPHIYKVDLSEKLYNVKNEMISEIRNKNV